jgi:hypothetical protein
VRERRVDTRYRFQTCPVRSATGAPDSISEALPREDVRVPVFTVAAMIFFEGQVAPLHCTVRDLSLGGARLELDRAKPPVVSEQLPDRVVLYVCPDRTDVECRVAWRDGRHFGVQFAGETRASTRRPV